MKLWNREGQELETFYGHSFWIQSVAFSPDGQTLATASDDMTVKLWNHKGQELLTLKGHSQGVLSVAFSPDGQTLASASRDKTVILWNFDLDDLVAKSCKWLEDYLVTHEEEKDLREICGIKGKTEQGAGSREQGRK